MPAMAQPAAMATANTSVPTRTIMLMMVMALRPFTRSALEKISGPGRTVRDPRS